MVSSNKLVLSAGPFGGQEVEDVGQVLIELEADDGVTYRYERRTLEGKEFFLFVGTA